MEKLLKRLLGFKLGIAYNPVKQRYEKVGE